MPDPSFSSSSSVVALRGGPLVHPVRNPGVPFDRVVARRPARQSVGGRAPRVDARHAPRRQERRAGRLAAQGRHLHRPHDAQRRRHRRPRANASARRRAVRCATICSTRSAWRRSVDHDGRGVRLSPLRRKRPWTRSKAAAFRSRRYRRAFPPDSIPHPLKLQRDRGVGCGRRGGDRHRRHARTRADRQLAGALRRRCAISARPAAMRT